MMKEQSSVSTVRVSRTENLRVLACASQGTGGHDEARLRALLSHFDTTFLPFRREDKLQSFKRCMRAFRCEDHDLLVLEGTGIGAGLPAIVAALLFGRSFILSSGDAIGPFLSAQFPLGSPVFHLYERLLYQCCSGFIGWTPYLVGRALTMGAKRAITCSGWAPYNIDRDVLKNARGHVRARLGIPADAVAFGIAGSLTWSKRYQYCYGLELVNALHRSSSNACVLIVGDGSGLPHLQRAAGGLLGKRIFLTGRVRRDEVPEYLAAMDMGSLPQSVDGVGSFRYTTKLSEYRCAGLPFFTNQTPASYDLDRGDIWRLPGTSPWDETFLAALSQMMNRVTLSELSTSYLCTEQDADFDHDTQIRRVKAFLRDIADARVRRVATTQAQVRPA